MTEAKAAFNTLAVVCATILGASHPLWADTIVRTDNVEAELVSDMIEVAPGAELWVALRQKIKPNWHTYWKNPGDSGQPIRIDWTLPPGFEAGDIEWPAPERLAVGPLMNFGYSGEVFLLTRMKVSSSVELNRSLPIKAHAEWLVCYEICIPEEADLDLSLRSVAAPGVRDPVWGLTLDEVRQHLPRPSPWTSAAALADGKFVLSIAGSDIAAPFSRGYVREAIFFPDEDGWIRNAAPQSIRFGNNGFAIAVEPGFRVVNSGKLDREKISGVVVLRQSLPGARAPVENAFLIDAAVGPILPGTTTEMLSASANVPGDVALWRALALAVLGGLILNLMPCVLPILSMKAVGFVGKIGADVRRQRLNGLAYAAGVISTFVIVAGVLLTLRAAGEEIGWGFQLQSPIFVILMAYLMFVIGLNLAGIFEIGGSLMNVRGFRSLSHGHQSAFGIGVVAVVVATPCTAPFMATAMGFALTQSAATALLVFIALGLGMALPYLALTWSPALSRLLPKPGPWLVRFRQLLAFPMFATVVWLVWVLSIEAGSQGVLAALAGMVLISFAAWLLIASHGASLRWLWTSRTIGAGAIALALALSATASTIERSSLADASTATNTEFESYAPERVAALRAQGKAVFVDFTAAWCVTCLWNEKAVLNRANVAQAFKDTGVVFMKADWTNKDARITQALARYGRNGVPLYLLYPPGPGGEDGAQVLPQILTTDIVLSALTDLALMAGGSAADEQASVARP